MTKSEQIERLKNALILAKLVIGQHGHLNQHICANGPTIGEVIA